MSGLACTCEIKPRPEDVVQGNIPCTAAMMYAFQAGFTFGECKSGYLYPSDPTYQLGSHATGLHGDALLRRTVLQEGASA